MRSDGWGLWEGVVSAGVAVFGFSFDGGFVGVWVGLSGCFMWLICRLLLLLSSKCLPV